MSDLTFKPTDAIDLHMHTTYSDGHWNPTDLFDQLSKQQFRVVAVTDHDRIDRIEEMRVLGAARGIHVVPGVEVTTSWHNMTAHLLCYAPEFVGDTLRDLTHATERAQYENTQMVYAELLKRGYTFPQQAEVLAENGGEVVRPIDNVRLVQAHNHAASAGAAFALIGSAGFRSIGVALADAVAAAHESGAITVLAHPGRADIQRYEPAQLVEMFAEVPFDGIEVYYPTHTPEQVALYEGFAREHNLATGAGSDSHGPRQRLPIVYPAERAARVLAHCGVTVAE